MDDRGDQDPGTAFSGLAAAVAYAAAVHRTQLRKGTTIPYLSHLLGVAALTIEDGGDEEEAIAALLHDAAEDHGGQARLDDIALHFGAGVSHIVAECSDTLSEEKEPWPLRKQRYLEHLRVASRAALRVCLADKIYNLRTIVADFRRGGEALWRRFDIDADPLWYYRSVLAILRERSDSPLVGELARSLAELEAQVVAAPHPVPDSYWVIPGRLLAGEYPGDPDEREASRRLRRLGWAGIDLYLDLTEPGEYGLRPYSHLLPPGVTHRRLPVPDRAVPEPEEMAALLDAIAAALGSGHNVYLHCFGGIGRTGTVVGCWLVRLGMPGEDALARIALWRAGTPDDWLPSPETPAQRRLVLEWREPGRALASSGQIHP